MFAEYYSHHVHSLHALREYLDSLSVPNTDTDVPYLDPTSTAYAYVSEALYHLDACLEELDFAARALEEPVSR